MTAPLRLRLRVSNRTRRLDLERTDLVPQRRTNPHTTPVLLPEGMGQPVRGSFTPVGTHWQPGPTDLANFPTVVNVPNGGNIDAAVEAASRGTRIVLEHAGAGASYTVGEGVLLHPKVGAGEVLICSQPISNGTFPRAATGYNARARAADASACARIIVSVAGGAGGAFIGRTVNAGGPGINADLRGYRFAGLHLTNNVNNFPLSIALDVLSFFGPGDGGATFLSSANEPREFTWDRCLIENTATTLGNGASFGCSFAGRRFALVGTSIINMMGLSASAEPKAVAVYPGSGEHYIDNCFLEGLGVNLMVGGWSTYDLSLLPRRMVMRRSHFYKRPAWYASFVQQLKNLLEYKAMQEVISEGCIFEGHRAYGQSRAYVSISNHQDFQTPAVPYQHWVRDMTMRYCILRDIDGGPNFSGGGGGWIYGNTYRARYAWMNHCLSIWGADAGNTTLRALQVGMPEHFYADNNTFIAINGHTFSLEMDSDVTTNARFRNNVMEGSWRSNTATGMTNVMALNLPGAVVERNLVSRDGGVSTPPNNLRVATDADIQYVNRAGGNYRLAAGSPGKNWGTDGFDVGVDHDGLAVLTSGCVSGDW